MGFGCVKREGFYRNRRPLLIGRRPTTFTSHKVHRAFSVAFSSRAVAGTLRNKPSAQSRINEKRRRFLLPRNFANAQTAAAARSRAEVSIHQSSQMLADGGKSGSSRGKNCSK